jgi:hypothetical protein
VQIPSERAQRTTDRALIADDPFSLVNHVGAAHRKKRAAHQGSPAVHRVDRSEIIEDVTGAGGIPGTGVAHMRRTATRAESAAPALQDLVAGQIDLAILERFPCDCHVMRQAQQAPDPLQERPRMPQIATDLGAKQPSDPG